MNSIKRSSLTVATFAAALISIAFIGIGTANAQVVTTMGPGDSGAQVTALQTFLAADTSVYPEGLVTGYYGTLTTAAVERFQCKYNIVCSGDVATTGYGNVGPITLAQIESLQGSASVPATTNDIAIDAPIMSPNVATVSSTSATIEWATDQPSESAVIYSLGSSGNLTNSPTVWSSTFGTSAKVTLTGLLPDSTYYYTTESINADGNVQYGIGNNFTTAAQ